MVKICEEYRGTQGGNYYYVAEGHLLRHISRYAIKRAGEGALLCWDVPIEKVAGKPIINFSYSKSGYSYVAEYRIEDFVGRKYAGFPDYEKRRWSGLLTREIGRLRGYEFEISNVDLRELVDEFRSRYAQMINEVRVYSKQLGFDVFFARHAARVEEAYSYGVDVCLFACLSNPRERSRLMSLGNVCRWLYQLWVLKLVCETLGAWGVRKRELEGKPCLWIEQGSPTPTCILETPRGAITCWFEFQRHEMEHLKGFIIDWISREYGRKHGKMESTTRVHVRPDIVVVRGSYRHASEIGHIDLMIECKEKKFQSWKADINEQIPAYLKLFKPRKFIVAALKSIPNPAKSKLASMGVDVVDDLEPNNRDAINQFTEILRLF